MEGWTKDKIREIQDAVADVTGTRLTCEVTAEKGPGLTVTLDGQRAALQAESLSALARGCFLLTRAQLEGKRELHVRQERSFRDCGVMLDMSRNRVLTVEAVKRFLRVEASLGMNFLMLYTEDTYEVPEYPAFGYLRGRYTGEELRELDAYAQSLGLELIPCVQTLGHLGQFLQWNTIPRDQPDVLLIDDPETYRFLEAAVRSLRENCSSHRIHIGMDEAYGVGLGRYLREHGPTDHFALLNRHLDRVCAICRKYDFEPMMWSDMFFRLGSVTEDYYDPDIHVPDSVIAGIPDVRMVYWDYYHQEEEVYTRMLREHARMGRGTVFAGGNWAWSGFLPHLRRTEATMVPGLRAAARERVDTVFATMWADDGAETDPFLAAGMLPLFSESCWQGCECPDKEWKRMAEVLTGLPWPVYSAFGAGYPDSTEVYTPKRMIWGDPLYPLNLLDGDDARAIIRRCGDAVERMAPFSRRADCAYAGAVLSLTAKKAELLAELRPRYKAGDTEWLEDARDELLPEIAEMTKRLRDLHRQQWETEAKRFGWETLALRYGAALGRIEDVRHQIDRYLTGEIPAIEELEAEPRPLHRWQSYRELAAPTIIL